MKPSDCESLYSDGRHYDLENASIVEDIPFYLGLVRRYGQPVLELACGTGRITLPIAEAGYRITGLDRSAAMLSTAKAKAARRGLDVEWVQADCREFYLGRQFAFVLFPFNSIAHLHDLESIEACFARVWAHLAPHGRFVIDMFNPKLEYLIRESGSERHLVAEYDDPDGGGRVIITEDNVYDRADQVNRIKWHFSIGGLEDAMIQDLNMRIFYPQELDALLKYNGLPIESKYGDYDGSPFTSDSPKQLVVCVKG
ncbi:MAG TPA: class I SAM-dependent methyltransferase [Anaerolineae bacterium]|nr:class I SAM-dependent methyltransferase [Anaerolineae bacterium]HNS50486.1 class I SAM-dependent methyltransferase [Anaerolineae bacterium]